MAAPRRRGSRTRCSQGAARAPEQLEVRRLGNRRHVEHGALKPGIGVEHLADEVATAAADVEDPRCAGEVEVRDRLVDHAA
jgi:hypothetical protein